MSGVTRSTIGPQTQIQRTSSAQVRNRSLIRGGQNSAINASNLSHYHFRSNTIRTQTTIQRKRTMRVTIVDANGVSRNFLVLKTVRATISLNQTVVAIRQRSQQHNAPSQTVQLPRLDNNIPTQEFMRLSISPPQSTSRPIGNPLRLDNNIPAHEFASIFPPQTVQQRRDNHS